jgi:hypothetical protein
MSFGMEQEEQQDLQQPDTRTLLRDVAVLQVKLLVDGLRDLVLVPASLIAGLVSLVSSSGGKPGPQFYRLLGVGKQSESWINLFGAVGHSPEGMSQPQQFTGADIDEIVGTLEKYVVDEYQRGGVTKQARDQVNRALDVLQRRRRKQQD